MENRTHDILYLSHGGGPLPLLGDEGHREMVAHLTKIAATIEKPSAILLISAHWEEAVPTVTSSASPGLVYDYYGFPEEAYRIQYPCPGDPGLAGQVCQLLDMAGVRAASDKSRGFDHGLFVPLKIMFPDATIPCIQLSLMKGLDPARHIELGAALSGIARDRLLIVGSGFSFHNMNAFFTADTTESAEMNARFEQWLIHTCSDPDLDEHQRSLRLKNWGDAPFARYCHPREEHLLPLHVCYGAAGTACRDHIELTVLNKKCSFYLW